MMHHDHDHDDIFRSTPIPVHQPSVEAGRVYLLNPAYARLFSHRRTCPAIASQRSAKSTADNWDTQNTFSVGPVPLLTVSFNVLTLQ